MKIFPVLLLTIMVAIAVEKSMARYLLVKTNDGEGTDLIKARSPYPECEKKQCGDACSLGGLIGQCNEHRMCIFGGKPPNCVQECPGDLVYDDCHSDCDFCDSNGAGCTFLCIKGCGCPNELLRLSMDNPFTCVKREDCPEL